MEQRLRSARMRRAGAWLALGLACTGCIESGAAGDISGQHWVAARTTHFQTFSCGPTQEVARLAARLEQFRDAYGVLAGEQAVASPPIVVMAFPDHELMEPFVPLYNGKPANVAAFFSRGADENLISVTLTNVGWHALETVFHEYSHLLLRRNEKFWPMWLKEGMADIYSTFEVTGDHSVRIGKPLELYLALMQRQKLMPLRELFAVTRTSPGYNERERQGIFYAESWLLTHYLMQGRNGTFRAQFGRLTTLLRDGYGMEQAFTNAFRMSLGAAERELESYRQAEQFEPLNFTVGSSLYRPQPLAWRPVGPAESCFRLGDQLLRVGRPNDARRYFEQALRIAPASPLGCEGLGLLAVELDQHENALAYLGQAIEKRSANFLVYCAYARERMRGLSQGGNPALQLTPQDAAQIEAALNRSLALMPDFAATHHLLGLLEILRDGDLPKAEQQLRKALELEPDNYRFALTLARVQLFKKEHLAMRQTLEPLLRPYVDAEVRREAEVMLREAR